MQCNYSHGNYPQLFWDFCILNQACLCEPGLQLETHTEDRANAELGKFKQELWATVLEPVCHIRASPQHRRKDPKPQLLA